jgi:ATP/maltotriose-dependent transcriptional regulator MalT
MITVAARAGRYRRLRRRVHRQQPVCLDYLAEEVLERQPGQLHTVLLETSVLDRLSGPLCDAVTGREGSQELLEEAERAGLFLIPLDEIRGWWRYQPVRRPAPRPASAAGAR